VAEAGLLKRLDQKASLGFDVWDFSARSLLRPYGRLFLGEVLLRRPGRLAAGLREYRRRVRSNRQHDCAIVGSPSREAFEAELVEGDWLVGMGFCQKPVDPPCPSGRFNHRCLLLAQPTETALPAACRVCQIRELVERASPAGARIYIMTSAADIARDLLLPVLGGQAPSRVVLSVCPYSVPPLTLAMDICGLRGIVESYSEGACEDFAMWLRADEGDKRELTRLAPPAHQRLLDLVDRIAAARRTSRAPA
jgi:hypothetical protein